MKKKQKKWVWLLLILVLCVVYFTVGIVYSITSSKKIYKCESAISSTDSGDFYMIKNDKFQSEVFKFGADGLVKGSYVELTNGPIYSKKVSFGGVMASDGKNIYFLREYIDLTTNRHVQYDIVRLLDEEGGLRAHTVYTAIGEDLPQAWSITLEAEKVFLASVWSDNKTAQLEEFDVIEDGGLFLRATSKFVNSEEEPIVKAMYLRGNIVMLTSAGKVYVSNNTAEKLVFPRVEERQNLVSSSTVNDTELIFNDAIGGRIYNYNVLTDAINAIEISDFLCTDEYDAEDIIYMSVSHTKRSAALVTSTTFDNLEIIFWTNGVAQKISEFSVPIGVGFEKCEKMVWCVYGATLLAIILVWLAQYLLKRRKQIVFRFIKIVTIFVGCTLILFGVLEYRALYSQAYETRTKIAYELSDQVLGKLSVDSVEKLIENPSSRAESYASLLTESTLNNMKAQITSSQEGLCYYNQMMLVTNEGDLLVGPSIYDEFLMPIENIYSDRDCDLFYSALKGQEVKSNTVENYCGTWVSCAAPIVSDSGKVVGVLATLVDTGALEFEIALAMGKYAAIACVALAVLIFLVYFFFKKALKPLSELKTSFKEVADGNYSTRLVGVANDEFADINSTFNMMCEKIANSIYSLKTIKDNYNKFVPESVFKMFEETNIGKINVGDAIETDCVFAMQSISGLNEIAMKTRNKGAQLVEFTNQLFGIVSECAKASDGVVVSNGLGLDFLRVLFGQDGNEAVNYSLNVLGDVEANVEGLPKLNATTLIHKDKTIFGVAGDSDNAFPIVSSEGAEDLTQILLKLKDANIRVVATDSVVEDVRQEHNMRYLGFVSSKNKEHRYKLFEVLDACSAQEKSKKMLTQKFFEKGVELFYANNFYMARSEFSKVLQECQEDDIARWYLLVCDRYYKDPEFKASYELLGESIR